MCTGIDPFFCRSTAPLSYLRIVPPLDGTFRNTVGSLIEMCWRKQKCDRPQFTGICLATSVASRGSAGIDSKRGRKAQCRGTAGKTYLGRGVGSSVRARRTQAHTAPYTNVLVYRYMRETLRGVWLHRIQDFKQYHFNSTPPTPPSTQENNRRGLSVIAALAAAEGAAAEARRRREAPGQRAAARGLQAGVGADPPRHRLRTLALHRVKPGAAAPAGAAKRTRGAWARGRAGARACASRLPLLRARGCGLLPAWRGGSWKWGGWGLKCGVVSSLSSFVEATPSCAPLRVPLRSSPSREETHVRPSRVAKASRPQPTVGGSRILMSRISGLAVLVHAVRQYHSSGVHSHCSV